MKDSEITALAAKAYGDAPEGFSPLTDDGDALRLEVKLGLQIVHYADTSKEPECVTAGRNGSPIPYGDDPYAATRRAITRAAAQIGKGLP